VSRRYRRSYIYFAHLRRHLDEVLLASSDEPSPRGLLASSQARTSSRNFFSGSLSSKSIAYLSHGGNHVRRRSFQRIGVVEEEVLEHEQLDVELGVRLILLDDLVGGRRTSIASRPLKFRPVSLRFWRGTTFARFTARSRNSCLFAADDVADHHRVRIVDGSRPICLQARLITPRLWRYSS